MNLARPILALALLTTTFVAKAEEPLGLTVRDGVLLKSGKPVHAIGANYYSLFTRMIHNPADESSLAGLRELGKHHVPFVRFNCGGYWPSEQRLYFEKREEFLARLDRVVKTAEESGVGLIPSLFWYMPTASDLAGEPIDQLGVAGSKSLELIGRYTEDIVARYAKSPAIWGWEFGNEYNLDCDLPNAAEHRPAVVPNLGTPAKRTERDELKWAQTQLAIQTFATAVRRHDKTRPIFTGNAIPRNSAWHNWQERKWTADTPEQFAEILHRDNPDPVDTTTVHVYYEKSGKYAGPSDSIDGVIGASMAAAKSAGKPLFLGEFGAQVELGDKERPVYTEFLKAIEKHQVPLAAFWVFDMPEMSKDWNVSFTNSRAYMLESAVLKP